MDETCDLPEVYLQFYVWVCRGSWHSVWFSPYKYIFGFLLLSHRSYRIQLLWSVWISSNILFVFNICVASFFSWSDLGYNVAHFCPYTYMTYRHDVIRELHKLVCLQMLHTNIVLPHVFERQDCTRGEAPLSSFVQSCLSLCGWKRSKHFNWMTCSSLLLSVIPKKTNFVYRLNTGKLLNHEVIVVQR